MKVGKIEFSLLKSMKLHGAAWCNRRHRYVGRLRCDKTHPNASQAFLCRTAPEAAAKYNAAVRATRPRMNPKTPLNDFELLFRKTDKTHEGPNGHGSRILMIQPPFCWAEVDEEIGALQFLEWFVDPVSGRPARTRFVEEGGVWSWKLYFLDEDIWQSMGNSGTPIHRNGDQMDCRRQNLIDAREDLLLMAHPKIMTQPENIREPNGVDMELIKVLRLCFMRESGDSEVIQNDPWLEPILDDKDGRIIPRHCYQESDRKWIIKTARLYCPELLQIPEWQRRSELIRLFSRPWDIDWGTRRRPFRKA